VALVSLAHEWRPKASSQTRSTIFRPLAINVLSQRLQHLGPEAMLLVCHAAGPKGPTIPDDGFGGASTHSTQDKLPGGTSRRFGRLHGHHGPGRDKQYFSAHVTLSGSAGCAHLNQVRGVTRDQQGGQGPRPSQNRSLISVARAHNPSQSLKVDERFTHAAQISAPTHPPRDMGSLGVKLLHGAHGELAWPCHFTSRSALPTEATNLARQATHGLSCLPKLCTDYGHGQSPCRS
jgi:hypothetical protein